MIAKKGRANMAISKMHGQEHFLIKTYTCAYTATANRTISLTKTNFNIPYTIQGYNWLCFAAINPGYVQSRPVSVDLSAYTNGEILRLRTSSSADGKSKTAKLTIVYYKVMEN